MNKKFKNIVLASSSERRKNILEQIGLNFRIMKHNYVEDMTLNLMPKELVIYIAKNKAKSIIREAYGSVIIGVDTFIVSGKEKIGKPESREDAYNILRKISGGVIEIYSGLCIIDTVTNKEYVDYDMTKIKVRNLNNKEIKAYIETKEFWDKAGAFSIQGKGALLVESIEGCYYNVVGLPLTKLYELMNKIGINILVY